MKNFIVIVVSVLSCFQNSICKAQNDSTGQYIAGSIQFDMDKYTNSAGSLQQTRNSWNLYSGISWSIFIKRHLVIGLGFGVESNYQKSIESAFVVNTTIAKATTYTPQVFLRYFKPFSESWSWFSQLSFGGGFGNNKIIYNDEVLSASKDKQLRASIGLGINYRFHRHWSVEVVPLQLEYKYNRKPSSETSPGVETDSRFFFSSFTNGVYLSFNYHF